MKSSLPVFGIIILILLANSCSKQPSGPETEKPFAQLTLVNLNTEGELSKQLHYAEVGDTDINYGDIIATKELAYLVMNTGNVDVFDITFSSQHLEISPQLIGRIESNSSSEGLSALPIVIFTALHVLQPSNVGTLLPFEVGTLLDTIQLGYEYVVDSDTTEVLDEYSVSGTKLGAIVDILVSGEKVQDIAISSGGGGSWLGGHSALYLGTDIDFSNTEIVNSGNVPIRIRIMSPAHQSTALDTVLTAQSSINTSGVLAFDIGQNDTTKGESVVVGGGNTPYIFSIADVVYTSGYGVLVLFP